MKEKHFFLETNDFNLRSNMPSMQDCLSKNGTVPLSGVSQPRQRSDVCRICTTQSIQCKNSKKKFKNRKKKNTHRSLHFSFIILQYNISTVINILEINIISKILITTPILYCKVYFERRPFRTYPFHILWRVMFVTRLHSYTVALEQTSSFTKHLEQPLLVIKIDVYLYI